jgi:hypothetical protein
MRQHSRGIACAVKPGARIWARLNRRNRRVGLRPRAESPNTEIGITTQPKGKARLQTHNGKRASKYTNSYPERGSDSLLGNVGAGDAGRDSSRLPLTAIRGGEALYEEPKNRRNYDHDSNTNINKTKIKTKRFERRCTKPPKRPHTLDCAGVPRKNAAHGKQQKLRTQPQLLKRILIAIQTSNYTDKRLGWHCSKKRRCYRARGSCKRSGTASWN